jgi:tetraacyldisaccharide 4'-kinase
MRAPGFWWRPVPGWPAWLLSPLGWIYGTLTLRRMRRPGISVGIPVVCVGNFVAGGAGKTPTAIALARMLAARGEKPFVLMRGYGGRLAGPVAVDPAIHAASDVGDEALLMAGHAPTVVARDRPAGAALAKALGASLVVMDDGLQNPSLAKTLRLAVVDGASGVGNGLCLPAGPLRAPLAGQFEATDAVIVIGEGEAGAAVAADASASGLPVLIARLTPDPIVAAALSGQAVIAVSGIGRPEKFAATLRQAGATILAERPFGDHHAYTPGDVAALIAQAGRLGGRIATTEKDMTKLGPLWPADARDRLIVVPVTLVFDAPAGVDAVLGRALAASALAGAAQP